MLRSRACCSRRCRGDDSQRSCPSPRPSPLRGRGGLLMIALVLALVVSQTPSRLALSVGSNTGAEGRDQLWFAETDAQRFADALVELGQFERKNVTVLKGPSATELTHAL